MLHFHKEGAKSILLASFITFVIVVVADQFLKEHFWVLKGVQVLALLLLIVVLQFFRNPNRSIRPNEHTIVAPVDGKIINIEEVLENEYFKDKRLKISFLVSTINVHVTRYPLSGKVTVSKNNPQVNEYDVPKKSKTRQQSTIVIENKFFGEVLYQQMSGTLVKQNINYALKDTEVMQGDDAGFIKFGAKIDLFLPLGTKLNVKINEKVKGNKSIIVGQLL